MTTRAPGVPVNLRKGGWSSQGGGQEDTSSLGISGAELSKIVHLSQIPLPLSDRT